MLRARPDIWWLGTKVPAVILFTIRLVSETNVELSVHNSELNHSTWVRARLCKSIRSLLYITWDGVRSLLGSSCIYDR